MVEIERISTGVKKLDVALAGGVPKGFFVAVTGEPGTGKTILCLHFTWQGILDGDKCIYVTTEESSESIIKQAEQFNFLFSKAIEVGRLVIIDALMRSRSRPEGLTLKSLELEELLTKVAEAKRRLGRGHARLVIDSLSAFWLDKPAMARKYSYTVKRALAKFNMTCFATSQYAITTSEAFGFGVEHIADGIIRFRRMIRGGRLRRYLLIEKMRQTPHELRMFEVEIIDGQGMRLVGPLELRREDVALPPKVSERISRVAREKVKELGHE